MQNNNHSGGMSLLGNNFALNEKEIKMGLGVIFSGVPPIHTIKIP